MAVEDRVVRAGIGEVEAADPPRGSGIRPSLRIRFCAVGVYDGRSGESM